MVGNLGAGGLERFVTRISLRANEGKEFEPVVLCLSQRSGQFLPTLESAGIPILEAPSGWRRDRKALRELADIIRSSKADLAHSQVNFSLWQQYSASRRA